MAAMGAAGFAAAPLVVPELYPGLAPALNIVTPGDHIYRCYEHNLMDLSSIVRINPGIGSTRAAANQVGIFQIITSIAYADPPANTLVTIAGLVNGNGTANTINIFDHDTLTIDDNLNDITFLFIYGVDVEKGPTLIVAVIPGGSWYGPAGTVTRSVTILAPIVLEGGIVKLYRNNVRLPLVVNKKDH